jgi:hypothetical protein
LIPGIADVSAGFPANKAARQAVEAACEKAVFASPEGGRVRREICYRAARAAQHGTTYVARGDAAYAAELAPLRTAIELDRFGLVAHVFGDREGCTEEQCDALSRFSGRRSPTLCGYSPALRPPPAAGYRAPPRVPASAELRGRRQPPGLGKKVHREPAVLPQQLQHQRLHVVSEPTDLLRRHASLNQLARKSSTRYTRVTLPQGE